MSYTAAETGIRSPNPDYRLREYQATPPLDDVELPVQARTMIEEEINAGEQRLQLEYQPAGTVRLRATQHVGIITLPDGPTLEIRPKVPDTDLLGLIQYGHGVSPRTIEEETRITAGSRFIDALAALFEAELRRVLEQGLHREYRRISEATRHVRGRIDVQRQLQRHAVAPTTFECTYDELTVDTTVNRGILYATTILLQLVRDASINRALRRHQQRLRRRVELTVVRPIDLERVEFNRLMAYYEDLHRLTKLVLRSIYVDDLTAADRRSFALLIDMNKIFEAVVERAVEEAVSTRSGWSVETQKPSKNLVTGGARTITIQPDVLIRDADRTVRLVGDAKWKLDEPSGGNRTPATSDIYQLVAYQVAHQTPGVLFYPEQRGNVASTYDVNTLDPLTLVEVPVSKDDNRSLGQTIRDGLQEQLPATAPR